MGINCLCTDFDKTLTAFDTTDFLVEKVLEKYPEENKKIKAKDQWHNLSRAYINELQSILGRFFKQSYNSPQNYLEFLSKELYLLEMESTAKAESIFQYISINEIHKIGQRIELLPNVEEIFQKKIQDDGKVYIISMNWSRDLIKGAVNNKNVEIISNNIGFRGNQSCGRLNIQIATPFDKLQSMRKSNNYEGECVFVGDGIQDLWCLYEARHGILINPGSNTLDMINHMGINIMDITDKDAKKYATNKILLANSWSEIAKYLE